MEIWNGYRAGIDGAIEDYDADEAYAIDLLDEEIIEKLLNKRTSLLSDWAKCCV